jgi:hypothetical protein
MAVCDSERRWIGPVGETHTAAGGDVDGGIILFPDRKTLAPFEGIKAPATNCGDTHVYSGVHPDAFVRSHHYDFAATADRRFPFAAVKLGIHFKGAG